MTIIPCEQLLLELQEINPEVVLHPNPNRPGLSNFKIRGRDLCQAVLTSGLQTEWTPGYSYEFPNGMTANVKTYDQIKSDATMMLEKLKDQDFANEFFDIDA